MSITNVGDGKVVLIAGGGKIYADVAAKFTSSEKGLDEILATPEDSELVKKIISSGHEAALEFDYFLFGVEGYARVTETQLVRKRIASYMIKSGRANKKGNRSYDVVLPNSISEFGAWVPIDPYKVSIGENFVGNMNIMNSKDFDLSIFVTPELLNDLISRWYNAGVEMGLPEEDLRYMKPQGTEFKAIIGMNAHALRDWFRIRLCKRAQTEIRDLATKMYNLCLEAAPTLFESAGPNCKVLGYCPENKLQCESGKNKIPTKDEALAIIHKYWEGRKND